jgi:uncharacterized protein (DUF2141 family)
MGNAADGYHVGRVPWRKVEITSRNPALSDEVFALTQEATFEQEGSGYAPIKSRWQENHGNLLMAFVVLILLVGSGILIYRQYRFVPPRFPDANMIVVPELDSEGGTTELPADRLVAIRVAGAANDRGSIKVAIYGSEESFNRTDQALATNSLPLQDGEAIWILPVAQLPERMAIAAYHDENEDQRLTLNRLGIPSERYGFSQDARGLTGPPSFDEAVFDRPPGGETIFVFIR